MKRIIACLLALLLLFSVAAAEDTQGTPKATNRLTVGNPTPMRGDFFTSLWGNATSDLDVRDLLHGYNLITWDSQVGGFKADPTVVRSVTVNHTDNGGRRYTLTLWNDLKYSDGSPITAWDYAFSFLFMLSPEVAKIGGTVRRADQFLGYELYTAGRTPVLAGVRVPDDYQLVIYIREPYVPFFYEFGLLSCNPYPISVIAPGVTVKDDGRGVYLANINENIKDPIFTAELLEKTVLDPETGYRSHPSVVSGPYTLQSWDGETAEFVINDYYKGNKDKEKALIFSLVYTTADNDTQIEDLKAGKFGLLNKVMRQDAISAGIELSEDAGFDMTSYPRTGLCYIAFACERSTVSSEAVRKAIAWCLDREKLVEDYTGDYGQIVDGYYGVGQWMYGLASGSIAPPVEKPWDETDTEKMAAYERQLAAYAKRNLDKLTHYTVNTDKAIALLEQDGWKLNEDGIRTKNGAVLNLTMLYPEGNNIADYMQETFLDNLEKVGIKLTLEEKPMAELLSQWYQQEKRTADMIYMASNFDLLFDPNAYFGKDGSWAYTNLKDRVLQRTARAMDRTKPGDVLTYLDNWVQFQERFNAILPMIPVYSNIYYDFYTSSLHDYDIAAHPTWGEAIVGASLQ